MFSQEVKKYLPLFKRMAKVNITTKDLNSNIYKSIKKILGQFNSKEKVLLKNFIAKAVQKTREEKKEVYNPNYFIQFIFIYINFC